MRSLSSAIIATGPNPPKFPCQFPAVIFAAHGALSEVKQSAALGRLRSMDFRCRFDVGDNRLLCLLDSLRMRLFRFCAWIAGFSFSPAC